MLSKTLSYLLYAIYAMLLSMFIVASNRLDKMEKAKFNAEHDAHDYHGLVISKSLDSYSIQQVTVIEPSVEKIKEADIESQKISLKKYYLPTFYLTKFS